jgi:hypothetical protein
LGPARIREAAQRAALSPIFAASTVPSYRADGRTGRSFRAARCGSPSVRTQDCRLSLGRIRRWQFARVAQVRGGARSKCIRTVAFNSAVFDNWTNFAFRASIGGAMENHSRVTGQ